MQNELEAWLASFHPLPVTTAADEELIDQPQVALDTAGVVAGSSSTPPDVHTLTSARLQLSERLHDPPLFSVKKKDLTFFFTKLKFKLRGNADRFPHETSRLIYAHSCFDSEPATLVNPLMDVSIQSVDSLIGFLQATYGDPNKELMAWSQLDNLKQGKK